eukprot:3221392-Rhodomonas_salina.5
MSTTTDEACRAPRSTDWRHYLAYDIILGFLGTVLTLTAAYDFKAAHSSVKNPTGIVSGPPHAEISQRRLTKRLSIRCFACLGTLSEKAIVSYDEMIEHSFYQARPLSANARATLCPLEGSTDTANAGARA